MRFDDFDWDAGNVAKCEKHGVTINEIEDVLERDPLIAPDHRHSGTEPRFIAIGIGDAGRPIFVAFTLRRRKGLLLIRPISARFMHAKEAKRYGEQT
ncbi:MAG: BrnT family toxin [Beijerinckiaceae bacterium]|nr:BrnT family toxin [Beijerinckiaceae bacterium]